ncbi:43182_t:CDS:1, partial [Gigaspora margarita]
MFQDCGFEVYFHCEIVELNAPEKSKAEKASDNQRSAVNELMERTRDVYWRIKKKGDEEQMYAFVRDLKSCLDPVLHY